MNAQSAHAETIELSPQPEAKTRPLFNVENLSARVKKITTTDEGKLQVVLESEHMSDDQIAKVQDLLQLQQDLVLVNFQPVQGDLFN